MIAIATAHGRQPPVLVYDTDGWAKAYLPCYRCGRLVQVPIDEWELSVLIDHDTAVCDPCLGRMGGGDGSDPRE